MNILALDIATKTGWASYVDGVTESGVLDLKPYNDDYGHMAHVFHWWLDRGLANNIDLLICEATLMHGHAAYVLGGLGWTAQHVAWAFGVSRTTVAPSTLKKFITGSGRASKKDVTEAVRKLGFNPADDNEADALALLTYALEREPAGVGA